MTPPSDGSRNTISVSGRAYSALPQMSVNVPDFDVPVLAANGWQRIPTSAITGGPLETIGAKLRRLRAAATYNNPIEFFPLIGSVAWTASATFGAGAQVSYGGNVYKTDTGGTSGTTPPTGSGGSDGGITWYLIGSQTAPVLSTTYTTHNPIYSNRYRALTNSALNLIQDGATVFRATGGPAMSTANQNDIIAFNVNEYPLAGNIAGGSNGHNNWMTGITFTSEAKTVEIGTYSNSQIRSVVVDGHYLDSRVPSGTIGFPTYFTIDFTNVAGSVGSFMANGRQRHTITIELTHGESFVYASVLPSEQLHYPTVEDNFTAVLIGDSQGFGNTLPSYADAFHNQMKWRMGLPDIVPCCIGGTGMVATDGGLSTSYIGHALSDLAIINANRPVQVIFIEPSQNDNPTAATSPSAITGAAQALFVALRAQFPQALIAVMGCVTGGNINLAWAQANEAAVGAAVVAQQANGDNLIVNWQSANDPHGPWITGTGYVGAANNSGTSDVDINTDGQHMTASGHSLWAKKSVDAFFKAITNIP